jgi:cell wall-associated NlpC family hydrolase
VKKEPVQPVVKRQTAPMPPVDLDHSQENEGNKKRLGKLGQMTEGGDIYAAPSRSSHVYYHAKEAEYVVISGEPQGDFDKVLLKNGSVGFVPKASIAQLPYEVTASSPRTARDKTSAKPAVISGSDSAAIARYAEEFIDTPRVAGGKDLEKGIGGGEFIQALFNQIGQHLPASPAKQSFIGKPVTRLEDLKPGDRLYFWSKKLDNIGETAIYVGGGYMIWASPREHKVERDYLGSKKNLADLVAARR